MNLVIPRFFCRVLCPLGALLGVFSRFVIFRITIEEKLGKSEFAEVGPVTLGTAFFNRGRSLPHAMEIPCVVCEEVCPVPPKAIQTRDEYSCQGCSHICETQVEGPLQIARSLRYLMYHECYGDRQGPKPLQPAHPRGAQFRQRRPRGRDQGMPAGHSNRRTARYCPTRVGVDSLVAP